MASAHQTTMIKYKQNNVSWYSQLNFPQQQLIGDSCQALKGVIWLLISFYVMIIYHIEILSSFFLFLFNLQTTKNITTVDLNEFAQKISNLGGEFYRAAQDPFAAGRKDELLVSSPFVFQKMLGIYYILFLKICHCQPYGLFE